MGKYNKSIAIMFSVFCVFSVYTFALISETYGYEQVTNNNNEFFDIGEVEEEYAIPSDPVNTQHPTEPFNPVNTQYPEGPFNPNESSHPTEPSDPRESQYPTGPFNPAESPKTGDETNAELLLICLAAGTILLKQTLVKRR